MSNIELRSVCHNKLVLLGIYLVALVSASLTVTATAVVAALFFESNTAGIIAGLGAALLFSLPFASLWLQARNERVVCRGE